jgi:hypothetical protein
MTKLDLDAFIDRHVASIVDVIRTATVDEIALVSRARGRAMIDELCAGKRPSSRKRGLKAAMARIAKRRKSQKNRGVAKRLRSLV